MIDKFIKDGWVIVDVPIVPPFLNMGNITIDQHQEMSEKMWQSEYSLEAAKALLPIIQQLIGLDVMVQYMPYLRVARP